MLENAYTFPVIKIDTTDVKTMNITSSPTTFVYLDSKVFKLPNQLPIEDTIDAILF